MKYKLREIVKKAVIGGTPASLHHEYYDGGTIPWVNTKEINYNRIYSTEKNITSLGLENSAAKIVNPNSVIIAMYCHGTAGRVAINKVPVTTNQACCSLEIDETKADYEYVYYALMNNYVKLDNLANGAAQQNLNKNIILDFEIDLPVLETQKKIVKILSSLDQKIELNTTANKTMFNITQVILRQYMDNNTYLLKPLSQIADVIDCLHSKKPSQVEDGSCQLIQLNNIRDDGFLDMTACKYMISQADYDFWTRKCEIIEGDYVITNVGRIGAISRAPSGTKAAMGRNMTCIRLKPDFTMQSYFTTVLLSNHMQKQIKSNTDEGTIMGALNVKNIPKLLFPIFNPNIMDKLDNTLLPLCKQIEANSLQNQTLEQIRATLIPSLLSGKVDLGSTNE